MFNAIIGMYMVFKTTGFGVDTFWANFVALGSSYVDIFVNFSKILFNWIYDLFDHKIVPNVPGEGGSVSKFRFSNPWGWYTKPMHDAPLGGRLLDIAKSSKELYQSPFSSNIESITSTPWYKDLSFWLWFGGVASVIGVCYLGYQFITNPEFIHNLTFRGAGSDINSTVDTPTNKGVELQDGRNP